MVGRLDLSISEHKDEDEIVQQATELIDRGRWRLGSEGRSLERDFKFKTFKSTWAFMNEVADECKTQKHHPEWTNIFNRTHIRWTTHSPRGMSLKDVLMARLCDEIAEKHGEQWPDPQGVTMRVEVNSEECGCGEGKKT